MTRVEQNSEFPLDDFEYCHITYFYITDDFYNCYSSAGFKIGTAVRIKKISNGMVYLMGYTYDNMKMKIFIEMKRKNTYITSIYLSKKCFSGNVKKNKKKWHSGRQDHVK